MDKPYWKLTRREKLRLKREGKLPSRPDNVEKKYCYACKRKRPSNSFRFGRHRCGRCYELGIKWTTPAGLRERLIQLGNSRQCNTCKKIKTLWHFELSYDYLSTICRDCRNKVSRKGQRRRKQDPKYRESLKQKAKEYRQSECGKEVIRRGKAAYYQRNKKKVRARSRVHYAVRVGKIPHPSTLKCRCGKQATQYHHHNGYDKEHALDVVPVCVSCHSKIPRKRYSPYNAKLS